MFQTENLGEKRIAILLKKKNIRCTEYKYFTKGNYSVITCLFLYYVSALNFFYCERLN